MTRRNGRYGRKFNRAGLADPRGHWGTGVPASAGFMPQQQPVLQAEGYVFAGGRVCPPTHKKCPDGTCTPKGLECVPFVQSPGNQGARSSGMKLSRHGAPKTRLRHGMTKRKR